MSDERERVAADLLREFKAHRDAMSYRGADENALFHDWTWDTLKAERQRREQAERERVSPWILSANAEAVPESRALDALITDIQSALKESEPYKRAAMLISAAQAYRGAASPAEQPAQAGAGEPPCHCPTVSEYAEYSLQHNPKCPRHGEHRTAQARW